MNSTIFGLILPYGMVFAAGLVISLILTPLIRETNRRLGMVDKPDERRINKTPIPRGGSIAVVIATLIAYYGTTLLVDFIRQKAVVYPSGCALTVLGIALAFIGLADDKWSLPPKLKLLGQLVVGFLVWFWAGLGFRDLWPGLPAWIDCALTVFWIVGAINAFNLIDGLDGLASGLALIATLGMGGCLLFLGRGDAVFFHLAFAGALLGFLRYNYNPASVFLGDSGSMFIGYVISILPLCSHTPNSFLVSIGVPLLAMGVPIFDTALAILRRTLRRILNLHEEGEGQNDRVMTADADHLHHRILRSVGLSQRKAAWILYAGAIFLVSVGLVGMALRSHRAGLWLAAVTIGSIVIFRDMARIELFDAGRILNHLAHDSSLSSRRRIARWAVPLYVVFDVFSLTAAYFAILYITRRTLTSEALFVALPIRVFSTFACLVFFRTYRTIWSRGLLSNYIRLFTACLLGSVIGTVACYYVPTIPKMHIRVTMMLFVLLPFSMLVGLRVVRDVVRDLFYALDCSRLVNRKDVSRILVYGSGLRYRAFRRELVRRATVNDRIIVGLIDDDILLRDHYVGGLRVMGTINEAPQIITQLNVDAVVIACAISPEWLKVVKQILEPTGVRVTYFDFSETPA